MTLLEAGPVYLMVLWFSWSWKSADLQCVTLSEHEATQTVAGLGDKSFKRVL